MLEDAREDLKHWASRNKISKQELEDCMKYTVNAGDIQMEKGRMQIMAFVTDPYGTPIYSRKLYKRNASYGIIVF